MSNSIVGRMDYLINKKIIIFVVVSLYLISVYLYLLVYTLTSLY